MTIQELKQYILSKDKIVFILESLGCTSICFHYEKQYYSCCNADNGDNPTAVNVFKNEHLSVVNYTRDLKKISPYPDLITLVQYYKSCDFRQALQWLHDLLNLPMTSLPSEKIETQNPLSIFKSLNKYKKSSAEYKILNDEILLDYEPHIHKDFAKEGILPSTVKKFGLGYSYACHRTIIPVRFWQNGALIGVRGRTSIPNYDLFDIPKYFPLKPYAKSNNIYGLWEQYDDIIKSGSVLIFEGEKSTLKLDSFQPVIKHIAGRNWYGVSLCGHDLSDEQLRILCGLNLREYIVALDKDISEPDIWAVCEKFYGIRNVSYILDTNNLLGPKDSPIDKSMQTLVTLINNRIPYDANKHEAYKAYVNTRRKQTGG